MSRKKKEILPTPQELYENLNACINCVFEENCTEQLPFPLNMCEHCEKYIKLEKDF